MEGGRTHAGKPVGRGKRLLVVQQRKHYQGYAIPSALVPAIASTRDDRLAVHSPRRPQEPQGALFVWATAAVAAAVAAGAGRG